MIIPFEESIISEVRLTIRIPSSNCYRNTHMNVHLRLSIDRKIVNHSLSLHIPR